MVQWLGFTAEGLGSIFSWETKIPQARQKKTNKQKKNNKRERDEDREDREVEKGVDMDKISRNFPVIN